MEPMNRGHLRLQMHVSMLLLFAAWRPGDAVKPLVRLSLAPRAAPPCGPVCPSYEIISILPSVPRGGNATGANNEFASSPPLVPRGGNATGANNEITSIPPSVPRGGNAAGPEDPALPRPPALRRPVVPATEQEATVQAQPVLTGGSGAKGASHGDNPAWKTPRVFLLFLTIHGVRREELWQSFLGQADPSQYRAFIHCKYGGVCGLSLAGSNPLGLTQVDTVETHYCRDLVTAMVQLLRAAIAESGSPRDKFVFVSESTLPVKPFAEVYNALTATHDSDFCIYPEDHWVRLRLKQGVTGLLVKHSQWVVLNVDHARTMVERWPSVSAGVNSPMWSVPVYTGSSNASTLSGSSGLPLPMCVDEWAVFTTVFGAIIDWGDSQQATLPGFGPKPLVVGYGSAEQGACRTFAFWRADEGEAGGIAREITTDWPESKLSCFPSCPETHPADFVALSDRGARVLRHSRFLFARKFSPGQVPSVEQFNRIFMAR